MKSAKQKKGIRTTLSLLLTVLYFSVSLVGCSAFSFVSEPEQSGGTPTDTAPPADEPTDAPADPPPIIYYNRSRASKGVEWRYDA